MRGFFPWSRRHRMKRRAPHRWLRQSLSLRCLGSRSMCPTTHLGSSQAIPGSDAHTKVLITRHRTTQQSLLPRVAMDVVITVHQPPSTDNSINDRHCRWSRNGDITLAITTEMIVQCCICASCPSLGYLCGEGTGGKTSVL